DPFSLLASSIWGPYSLSTMGASSNQLIDAGRWRFNTVTGRAEEWVTAPLSTGLHAIGLHNVLNAGTGPSDLFNGEVGTFAVAPTPWTVVTSNATGKGMFNANSSLSLSGLSVRSFGVSAPIFESNLTIMNGDVYTETFSASNAGLIDIAIGESFPQGMDIDLYLYRWNGPTYSLGASSAGAPAVEVDALFALFDANPPVILSTTPTDGSSTNDASARIMVSYVDPQISAGIVDAMIAVDGTDFSFFGTFNETTLLWSLPFSFSEGAHTVTVQVFDGAGFSANVTWRFTVDTMAPSLSLTSPDYALTRIATTNVSGTTEVGATVTVNGATTGVNPTTGAFSRTILLGEGPNTITVVARDVAGNTAQVTRSVNLDTTPPIPTLTVPSASRGPSTMRVRPSA